ncbi:Uncharacterized conserved protein, contains GH25 family domain [Alteromonadaceae bacterium Bs31]|nr:Uncharacterized conserved protein, contains GH25 family domain [Alteromonadaceae bacterium Bs31]
MNIFASIKTISTSAVCVLAINSLYTVPANAHSRWVIPSHTVVSGDKPMSISLDYSISNDIFHPDIALGGASLSGEKQTKEQGANPMAALMMQTQASVVTPVGEIISLSSVNLGRKTSTFFTADKAGTYRVEISQPAIDVTLYKTDKGEAQRLFGTYEAVKSRLPKDANAIDALQFINRIQTFVTHNEISTKNLRPSGEGLELTHGTHPNELFALEQTRYQLMLNGRPIGDNKNSHVKITKAGTRFRNQRASLQPSISSKGEFQITWPEAGVYLLEADYEIESESGKVVYALFLTLEVHPE